MVAARCEPALAVVGRWSHDTLVTERNGFGLAESVECGPERFV
jgi:hypothetical protein